MIMLLPRHIDCLSKTPVLDMGSSLQGISQGTQEASQTI